MIKRRFLLHMEPFAVRKMPSSSSRVPKCENEHLEFWTRINRYSILSQHTRYNVTNTSHNGVSYCLLCTDTCLPFCCPLSVFWNSIICTLPMQMVYVSLFVAYVDDFDFHLVFGGVWICSTQKLAIIQQQKKP